MREELVVLGVHDNELRGQDDVVVEASTEQAGVEVAKICRVWGGMEEGEMGGDWIRCFNRRCGVRD